MGVLWISYGSVINRAVQDVPESLYRQNTHMHAVMAQPLAVVLQNDFRAMACIEQEGSAIYISELVKT